MATRTFAVQVATPQDLETMTMAYIARGFTVMNKTPVQVTLVKRKQISVMWLVIDLILIVFFFFGVILLIIYLIVYAASSDEMVTITVTSMAAPAYGGPMPQQPYSGQLPQPAYSAPLPQQPYSGQLPQQPYSGQLPSQPPSGQLPQVTDPRQWMNAPRSPDGHYWWNGQAWLPVPQPAAQPAAAPVSPVEQPAPFIETPAAWPAVEADVAQPVTANPMDYAAADPMDYARADPMDYAQAAPADGLQLGSPPEASTAPTDTNPTPQ